MRKVNLVTKDKEWAVSQLLSRQETIELAFGFSKTVAVESINHVHDGVHSSEVVAPKTTRTPVATQVMCLEFAVVRITQSS